MPKKEPKLNLARLETRMVRRRYSVLAGSVQPAQDSMDFGSVKGLRSYPIPYGEREKLALNKRLNGGHFMDRCPKETFKCQVLGCVEDHNTLLHPDPNEQVERTSATNSSFHGFPQNTRDGGQQKSAPTSQLSGTQRISQEQPGASGASMTAAK